MDNIYSSDPVEILEIVKHTPLEWSFVLNYKVEKQPGQFLIVSMPKFGEVPISISSFSNTSLEITIRKTGRVTSGIFSLKAGDCIYVRGPYGNGFPLEEFENRHLLVIAGGSAIAPAKSMLEYYLDNTNLKLRKLDVLVGFKSPQNVLFKKELEQWQKKCNVIVTVDNDEDYAWMGSIGFVVDYIKDVQDMGEDTKVVVIGPPLMMTNSVRELLYHKVKEENIYLSFERHMKCGLGKCGHCRIRDKYVCVDGPVFNYKEAKELID